MVRANKQNCENLQTARHNIRLNKTLFFIDLNNGHMNGGHGHVNGGSFGRPQASSPNLDTALLNNAVSALNGGGYQSLSSSTSPMPGKKYLACENFSKQFLC
jgi:hypothetical protein